MICPVCKKPIMYSTSRYMAYIDEHPKYVHRSCLGEALSNFTDEIVKRREFLCRKENIPQCNECGEGKQMQLVDWFVKPAKWKCRMCGYKFEFEPNENVKTNI